MIVNEISLVIQNIISFFQSLFLIFNPEIKTEILLETFTSRKTIYQKPRRTQRRISLNYFRSLIEVCLVFSSLLLPTAGKTFPFLLAQQWIIWIIK